MPSTSPLPSPGATLYAERRYSESAAAFAARCARHPADADAWLGRGQALLALGQWSEAWAALQTARGLVDHPIARAIIDARRAVAADGLGDPALAEACYRASLATRPDPATRGRFGILLLNQGRLDEAELELQRAQADGGPNVGSVAATLATIRTQRGQAEAALDALAGVRTGDPAVALARARACAALKRPADALPDIDAALPHAAPAQLPLLHHARATLLDQLDDVAGAAAAWSAMHALRGPPVDAVAIVAQARAIVDHWRPTPAPPAPAGAPRPVFLVGLPRSGTSLCEQSLAAHPGVTAAGEREELRRLAARLGEALGRPWPENTAEVPRAAVSAAAAWRAAIGGDRAVVIDKLPDNLLRLGLASQLFPDATAIWMRRGLMDTLLSCWQQAFSNGLAWAGSWDGLAATAWAYEYVGARWLAGAPMPMCVLRYEDLVRDPETELRDALGVLGLPWDDAVLAPERVDRVVRTASILQVREKVHGRSVGRWRRYATQLEPLRERLLRLGLDPE